MLIPRIGGPDVLFCIRPKEDGKEAVYRPAKIVSVGYYDSKGATVNMQVFTDGNNDREELGDDAKNGMVWRTSVAYDEKSEKVGTWKYGMYVAGPRMEEVEVMADIQHGRETIRKGAVGTWDQLRNTIRFNNEYIDGKHPDQKPEYAASEFIDWHIARLNLPEDYVVVAVPAPMDGKERPHERQEYLNDLVEEWMQHMSTPFPTSIRRVWQRGLERQKAIEQFNQQKQQELADKAGETGQQPLITKDSPSEDQTGTGRRSRQLQHAR